VGATAPADYGDYFAWGETTPKENYSWETYKFWVNADGADTAHNLKIQGRQPSESAVCGCGQHQILASTTPGSVSSRLSSIPRIISALATAALMLYRELAFSKGMKAKEA